jgi:hypothetical protein
MISIISFDDLYTEIGSIGVFSDTGRFCGLPWTAPPAFPASLVFFVAGAETGQKLNYAAVAADTAPLYATEIKCSGNGVMASKSRRAVMRTIVKTGIAAGLLFAATFGASAHYYVPGGYGYYSFGPYRHDAAQRFYACEHFNCASGCCPVGSSIQDGFCRPHVVGWWRGW